MSKPELKSPYNFVELNRYVHFPDWAEQVSQDVPFRDGLSGSFELFVEAKTPIFTRDDGDDETAFLNLGGDPFLKGSSIRGMLRNVLKIASFGKMDGAEEQYFGIRDLGGELGKKYSKLIGETIKAGWYCFETKEIQPCKFGLVSHKQLEEIQKSRGNHRWKKQAGVEKRYDGWVGGLRVRTELEKSAFKKSYLKIVGDDVDEAEYGDLVFTGYIGRKEHEFFFYERGSTESRVKVSDREFKRFEMVHSSSQQRAQIKEGEGTPNETWGYWKERSKQNSSLLMPVFYVEKDNEPGALRAFGLPMMFRIPSATSMLGSIHNVSPKHLDLKSFDLVELMFGYAPEDLDTDESFYCKRDTSLKGRVSITHARVKSPYKKLRPVMAILSSPRASFYPAYLQQSGKLVSWFDAGVHAHGWKRYPARGEANKHPSIAESVDLNTTFVPLDAGVTFKSTVYFHNLKPVELGALLWSVGFGGHVEGLVHRLGMAKSYGYGEVSLRYEMLEVLANDVSREVPTAEGLVRGYERYMSLHHPTQQWLDSTQIVELLSMANPKYGDSDQLQYEPGPGKGNGFQKAKEEGVFLQAPGGVNETLKELAEKAAVLREEVQAEVLEMQELALVKKEQQRKAYEAEVLKAQEEAAEKERQRRAGLTADERVYEDIEGLSEEEVKELARVKIYQGEADEGEREALRSALFGRYYGSWSAGRQVVGDPVFAGAGKLKEYAKWLEPAGGVVAAEEEAVSSRYGHLVAHDREILDVCCEAKDKFREVVDRLEDDDDWSAEGLGELVKLMDVHYPAKKMKKKDKAWREERLELVLTKIKAFAH